MWFGWVQWIGHGIEYILLAFGQCWFWRTVWHLWLTIHEHLIWTLTVHFQFPSSISVFYQYTFEHVCSNEYDHKISLTIDQTCPVTVISAQMSTLMDTCEWRLRSTSLLIFFLWVPLRIALFLMSNMSRENEDRDKEQANMACALEQLLRPK